MKKMLKGNMAIAEAALRGGMQVYAGYPITPSTEVMEYLSGRMPELGRTFIQAESEIAAINMVFGCGAAGVRSLTASSGPGMALKQEGISYMCRNNIPAVLLNVTRWGTGLGSLNSGQTDYLRDTRGGGQGGYRVPVLAPNSVQEGVDIMYSSFELSEKYRCPVIIMTCANLGQMVEPCSFPPFKDDKPGFDWALDGTGKGRTLRDAEQADMKTVAKDLLDKVAQMEENEQRWESFLVEDAEYVFVAFGLPSRACRDAVKTLREAGEKVGLIRPISLWPFPVKAFAQLGEQVKGFISVEGTDVGQMIEDVALASKRTRCLPCYLLNHSSVLPTVKQITAFYGKVKDNCIQEVF